jgi:hypothetical protein
MNRALNAVIVLLAAVGIGVVTPWLLLGANSRSVAAVAPPDNVRAGAHSPTSLPSITAAAAPTSRPTSKAQPRGSGPSPVPSPSRLATPSAAPPLPPPAPSPTANPTPNTGPVPLGQTGNWKLIFDDEFNDTSLNTSKWTAGWMGTGITGPVNPLELACYSSANATEPGDGTLHLLLVAKSNTCIGGTHAYTGAMVSSNGKFQFTYGYEEFRIYLPAASAGKIANWPAAWSFSKVNSACCQGEDDTMEGLAGNACFHFHGSAGGPGACVSGNYTGWHTYASYWRAGVVDYYYDGVHVGQITAGITSNPQYLILDNTLMTSSNTSSGPLLIPADMLVDHVRVWTAA